MNVSKSLIALGLILAACEKCLEDKTDACDTQTASDYEALEKTPGYVAWDKCEADAKCESLPE